MSPLVRARFCGFAAQQLSPPQRLPLGIPIKISQHKSFPTIQRGLCGGERLSSVPDKTAIRLRWLKLVRRVGPLRVSQNRHFVSFVLSVVGSPFCYKFCLESVPLNPNHYGFPRNRTRPCRKNRQNRSLKT